MSHHPREFSEESAASYDSARSEDARLARRAEEVLSRNMLHQDSNSEESNAGESESEDTENGSQDEESNDDSESEEDDFYADEESSAHDTSHASSSEAADMDTLRRSLSIHSQITITSSFAERMEKAKLTPNAPFMVIGRGSAGTVFEIPGTEFALKKGSIRQSIWADSQMTNLACKAVMECTSALEHHFPGISVPRVPRVHDWVADEDMGSWWENHGHKFTNVVEDIDDTKRGHIFCVQRILPLHQSAREALIRTYFPADEIEYALVVPYNKSCLVRPYFGQRRSVREVEHPQVTLENYPLYLDQLLHINLDLQQYVQEMAIGLALVHWRAQLDGMDIEFVIGSATSQGELPTVLPDWRSQIPLITTAGDIKRRTTHLWVLDFDKAEPVDFINDWKACCKQMVTAVTANDPYFPNPVRLGQQEQAIWSIFEDAYIKAAQLIIEMDFHLKPQQRKAACKLPKRFIKEWKKRAQEQLDDEDGGFIQFG